MFVEGTYTVTPGLGHDIDEADELAIELQQRVANEVDMSAATESTRQGDRDYPFSFGDLFKVPGLIRRPKQDKKNDRVSLREQVEQETRAKAALKAQESGAEASRSEAEAAPDAKAEKKKKHKSSKKAKEGAHEAEAPAEDKTVLKEGAHEMEAPSEGGVSPADSPGPDDGVSPTQEGGTTAGAGDTKDGDKKDEDKKAKERWQKAGRSATTANAFKSGEQEVVDESNPGIKPVAQEDPSLDYVDDDGEAPEVIDDDEKADRLHEDYGERFDTDRIHIDHLADYLFREQFLREV